MKTKFIQFILGLSAILLLSFGMQAQTVSYLWSNGATTPGISVNPTQTTTYYLTITQGGVQYRDSVTIVVDPAPPASITAVGSTSICTGASVTLNANTGTGLSYVWKKDGTAIPGATGSSYAASEAGSYTVAQNEETCVVYGMPREAVKLGAAVDVLPLERVADALLHSVKVPAHA